MYPEVFDKAYCTKDGKNYAEIYNKESFETAIKDIIKKIKETEVNLKLKIYRKILNK